MGAAVLSFGMEMNACIWIGRNNVNLMIQKEEIVSINIPAGVEEGMQLKVSGKGNAASGVRGVSLSSAFII